uniref:U3 small nucleolar RNA-associated protein 15 homolog n=1 Tax=Microcebus murinus TaxID=30608 RepID=A0A8C5YD61_MICMU
MEVRGYKVAYVLVAIQTHPILGIWCCIKSRLFSSASSRIHIYGRYSQEPIKTFSRFKDTAYCATFRQDGKLLVAGSEDGGIQPFDISGRTPLRRFEGHTKAVHVVDFTADKYHVVFGADDYTVKLWDIPNSKEILTFKEHSDYARCGCASKLNSDLFITGSYDHTVKMFDARTNKSVLSVEHGQPVESVLLFPSGGLLVSAGGRYVKVWDMLKGGQLLVSLKNHHKTVTCLCLSSSGQRKVKVYSTASYKVVHSFDYAALILSLALSHQDETIVVGMTNGILSVNTENLKHLTESLSLLVTVSIIKELNRRGDLANALVGQNEKEISHALNILIRNLSQPRFAPVLINVAEIIIDIYLPVIGQSPVVDKKFLVLQGLVEKEIDYQKELLETLGMMDMLFATMRRKESTSMLEHTSDGFLEKKKIES